MRLKTRRNLSANGREPGVRVAERSVAVLYFENMSGVKEDEYWRRIGYIIAPDVGSLVAARNGYFEAITGDNPNALEEFNSICSSHDDYIWRSVAGSQQPADVGTDRAPVGCRPTSSVAPTRPTPTPSSNRRSRPS